MDSSHLSALCIPCLLPPCLRPRVLYWLPTTGRHRLQCGSHALVPPGVRRSSPLGSGRYWPSFMRERTEATVLLGHPRRERRQDLPTGGMYDQGGRLVDVKRSPRPTVLEGLRPDAVADDRNPPG